MRIDKLASGELARFRALRLEALRDAPEAFGTTWGQASKWPESRWSELFNSMVVFIAGVGDEDVGMLRGGSEGGSARLGSLWVRRDARRRGVAATLIEAVTDWATSEGYERITLQVGVHQAAARRMYEEAGFAGVGEPISYPPPQDQLSKLTMARRSRDHGARCGGRGSRPPATAPSPRTGRRSR